jgi:hypothetical protein
VIPAVPPKAPNVEALPRDTGVTAVVVPVVKLQGFATGPGTSELPTRSLAPDVTVAVYVVAGVRLADGVNVAIWSTAL